MVAFVESTQTVALTQVTDDTSWPTDDDKISGLRAVLKAGKSVPSLVLHQVVTEDGTESYTLIDGFHRFRAMQAEGVTSCHAIIRQCSEREAELDRIQASLDKPATLLRERAVAMLRSRFVRDILDMAASQPLFAFEVDPNERGNGVRRHPVLKIVRRNRPLPTQPDKALIVMHNHYKAATKAISPQVLAPLIKKGHAPDAVMQRYYLWIDEIGRLFGKSRQWVNDCLRMTIGPVVLAIGDEDFQFLIMAKQRAGDTGNVQYALAALGLEPQILDVYMTRAASLQLLQTHTLQQLENIYKARKDEFKQKERDERSAEEDAQTRQLLNDAQQAGIQIDSLSSQEQSALFAIGSARFMPIYQEAVRTHQEANAGPDYTMVHTAILALKTHMRAFLDAGGDLYKDNDLVASDAYELRAILRQYPSWH